MTEYLKIGFYHSGFKINIFHPYVEFVYDFLMEHDPVYHHLMADRPDHGETCKELGVLEDQINPLLNDLFDIVVGRAIAKGMQLAFMSTQDDCDPHTIDRGQLLNLGELQKLPEFRKARARYEKVREAILATWPEDRREHLLEIIQTEEAHITAECHLVTKAHILFAYQITASFRTLFDAKPADPEFTQRLFDTLG